MNLLDVRNLLLALSFKLRKSSEFLIVDKRSDFVVNARELFCLEQYFLLHLLDVSLVHGAYSLGRSFLKFRHQLLRCIL